MFFNHKNTEPGQPQGSNPFFYYGGNYPGETSEPFYHSGIKNYNLRVSISTHIGKVRGNHEDNFYLEGLYMNDIFRNDFSASYTIHYADGMSFAVFDGMGGAAYGEVASEIAVQTLQRAGVISGMPDGSFQPFGTATREQACVVLCGLHDFLTTSGG
jgi:hypothetical protein